MNSSVSKHEIITTLDSNCLHKLNLALGLIFNTYISLPNVKSSIPSARSDHVSINNIIVCIPSSQSRSSKHFSLVIYDQRRPRPVLGTYTLIFHSKKSEFSRDSHSPSARTGSPRERDKAEGKSLEWRQKQLTYKIQQCCSQLRNQFWSAEYSIIRRNFQYVSVFNDWGPNGSLTKIIASS